MGAQINEKGFSTRKRRRPTKGSNPGQPCESPAGKEPFLTTLLERTGTPEILNGTVGWKFTPKGGGTKQVHGKFMTVASLLYQVSKL